MHAKVERVLGGLGYSVEWRPGDLLHYWYTMPSIRYTVRHTQLVLVNHVLPQETPGLGGDGVVQPGQREPRQLLHQPPGRRGPGLHRPGDEGDDNSDDDDDDDDDGVGRRLLPPTLATLTARP